MLTQFESYQLSHVINNFIGISKIPVNTASAKIQGRFSPRQSLGSLIPDLIKDDSFVLISSLSGPNDLDEESCSLIGCYGGQACDSSQ
jgi:hypothetical protein